MKFLRFFCQTRYNFCFILLVMQMLMVVTSNQCFAQEIFSTAVGDSTKPAVIFLHGGPGFNAINFEITTAKKLADLGYYVITYDRRGEGRSTDKTAMFTYKQTIDDLLSLFTKYSIKKASLIGHSFGGIVATKFANEHPTKVSAIVYASAPIRMQSVFKNILQTARPFYEKKKDSTNLRYISMLETMDTNSIEYSSYCFSHAMVIGAYSPKKMTASATEIYTNFRKDPQSKKAFEMNITAPKGFWKNEKYTTQDLTNEVKALKSSSIPMYGIYGLDDGLFSSSELMYIEELLGKYNFYRLENSSHSIFMDTQMDFLSTIDSWIQKSKSQLQYR